MKKKRFKGEAVFTAMEKCFLIKLNRPVLTECVCVCVRACACVCPLISNDYLHFPQDD